MKQMSLTLRAAAAAGLLLAGTASFANTPEPLDAAIASLQSAFSLSVAPGEQADAFRELFATVLQRVERSHAREVDFAAFVAAASRELQPLPDRQGEPADVFKKAINAGLRTLDAHSRYLDPRAHGNERSDASGSFGGLGLEVEPSDAGVRVIAPMPGTPAARAGLQSGDLIVRVDDQPLAGVPLPDAIARMRGEPGTPVALTVRRAGTPEDFTVSVTRDTIRRQAVRWNMEGDVLVLRVGSFTGAISSSVEKAIAEATASAQPRAVVLDMRGNPGGLLREAVKLADTFLKEGEIVSLRGRTPGNQRSWQADASELLAGVPMAVMVDARSASAAELVAAALQENGRAKVIGQRSFGKGTVQSTYTLGDDRGALRLTTAIYHGPSGRTVQQIGVAPDIELVTGPSPERPQRVAADAQGVLKGEPPPVPTARVEQARCAAAIKAQDPALACAMAYLRTGDIAAFVSTFGEARP